MEIEQMKWAIDVVEAAMEYRRASTIVCPCCTLGGGSEECICASRAARERLFAVLGRASQLGARNGELEEWTRKRPLEELEALYAD